jgi:ribosomal protein L11 methylase PrmA
VTTEVDPGSFRDPSGFVFRRGGRLYRQVNRVFGSEFDRFMSSGLYDELAGADLLTPHEQVGLEHAATPQAHAVIAPERVPFVSYPYEWCFGQLQAAALLTLEAQDRALGKGFVLRDASAYNVQFRGSRPLLIDTLSFEPYEPGRPWQAYGQFCEQFLAPLALMSRVDVRCAELLRSRLEGIPLELASRLLPRRTFLSPSLLLHVHLHARAQRRYAGSSVAKTTGGRSVSESTLRGLVTGLRSAVEGLDYEAGGTTWADYADDNSYSDAAADGKRRIVGDFLAEAAPRLVWDLGANTGRYTQLAREQGAYVVAFDLDPAAVERHWRSRFAAEDTSVLPLVTDLANPSPAQGWAHRERQSLAERGPADVVLALALLHHLALSRNLPLASIAAFFARLAPVAVVEFVPKEDSQVQRLLQNRPDIFPDYTAAGFEQSFGSQYHIVTARPVPDSTRVVYLLRRRDSA